MSALAMPIAATPPASAPAPSELAIRATDLAKCYEIYAKPSDRLLQTLFHGRRRFYREFWALRNISLEVRRGETLGIIGRNGSGKSTLLQLLCGTLHPTTGTVAMQGRVAALLELGAGFNPEFTGRENVYLNARIMGLAKAQTDQRFDQIAAFADIGQFIDQPVKTYSSGMYVRLAFAVIAHLDADILVIDEALAVGDVFFTQKCMRFLRSFREKGTIVFVSHDSAAVVNLCHRALWLDQGILKACGNAKAVSEAYLAESYLTRNPNLEKTAAIPPQEIPPPCFASPSSSPLEHGPRMTDHEASPSLVSFGHRRITLTSLSLLCHGRPLTSIIGGEPITLTVRATAHQPIPQVIVGFYVKDRLGQNLFGQNTFAAYKATPIPLAPGQALDARFTFTMPTLLRGDYTVDVSVAEGTQEHHTMHHWLRDAYAFKSHSNSESCGLVGIPMETIELMPQETGL